jgi:hypothetical protein
MAKTEKLEDEAPKNVGSWPTKYKPEYAKTAQFLA